jgi:paraquat-inducible protein A
MAFQTRTSAFETPSDVPGPGLTACPDCDLVQREPECTTPCVVRCRRCGALIYRAIPHALDATLALMLAAAVLFVIANTFPVLSLDLQGRHVSATLLDIAYAFHDEGMPALGVLVFLTLVLLPGLQIVALLYLLLSVRFKRVPWAMTLVSRALGTMRRWSMVEVFVLAAVVCMHRLSQIADLEVHAGFWAIGVVMLLFAMTDSIFDVRDLWAQLAEGGMNEEAAPPRAHATAEGASGRTM